MTLRKHWLIWVLVKRSILSGQTPTDGLWINAANDMSLVIKTYTKTISDYLQI